MERMTIRLFASVIIFLVIASLGADGALGRMHHRSSTRTAKKTSRKIVVYTYGLTVAEIYRSPHDRTLQYCKLTELKDGSECESTLQAINRPVRNICHKKMMALINECMELKNEESISEEGNLGDDTGFFEGIWNAIYPGTKWCGAGHLARNYFDLGSEVLVDKCCRAHDHCPIKVRPWQFGYGERNYSPYTKSHCDCDIDFFKCLTAANSSTADTIGDLFFNAMRVSCLREKPGLNICPNAGSTESKCHTASLIDKLELGSYAAEIKYLNRTCTRRSRS
ncbi:uncharacterized protein LOC100899916 [Galendromus occidentalis]|uniref:Uncharacterized protein LOC100899916 n=1 Tax=Galendromus occidentalis TaxID=34638 RepID=A0AAJ6QQZ9_9ACAR|nr:uncharacterized protein LOC100899916 [Galendromus occidentalis]